MYSQDESENHTWRNYLEPSSQWLHEWLTVLDNDPDFRIVLSTHEEMVGREREPIAALLRELDAPSRLLDLRLSDLSGKTHIRKGAKDEWLDFFPNRSSKDRRD